MPQVIRKFKDPNDLAGSSFNLKQILLQNLNYHKDDVGRLEKVLSNQRSIEQAYTELAETDPKIISADKKIDALQKQVDKLEPVRKQVEKLSDQYEKKEGAIDKIEAEYKKNKKDEKQLRSDPTYKQLKKEVEKAKKAWLDTEKKIKDLPKINKQLQLLKDARKKFLSDAEKSLGLTLISDGTRFLFYIGKKLHITVPIKN